MSGKNECDTITSQIREQGNNIKNIANAILNPFNIDLSFGGNAELTQNIQNTISSSLTVEDILDVKNLCQNTIDVEQLNEISNSAECINLARTLCAVPGSSPQERAACAAEFLNVSDINQQNVANIHANCVIDGFINKISEKGATTENIADILSLQQAKGPLSSSKINSEVCNSIRSDTTARDILNAYSECINRTSNRQINRLNACSAVRISQGNFYESVADCLVQNTNLVESNLSNNIRNEIDLTQEQEATGIDPGGIFGNLFGNVFGSAFGITSSVIVSSSVVLICCVIIGIIIYMVLRNR